MDLKTDHHQVLSAYSKYEVSLIEDDIMIKMRKKVRDMFRSKFVRKSMAAQNARQSSIMTNEGG